MIISRIACVILTGVCLLAIGCSDHQARENTNVKDLETKIAMTLPSDTVLLGANDGGGRVSGFYTWTVFSPSPIKMPPMHATGVKDYLDLSDSLADVVTYVEVDMGRRKISQPQAAFTSEWENDLYTFSGTVVRSAEGDYLTIRRFLKK